MLENAKWIEAGYDMDTACPIFKKNFAVSEKVVSAKLYITAMGVYEATLNHQRVGKFVLAPGFTSYHKRHQVQEYDITEYIREENELTVTVGNGWYSGYLAWMKQNHFYGEKKALIASVILEYTDGGTEIITDDTWLVARSNILMAEIYDGENYDANYQPVFTKNAVILDATKDALILQEGEEIREQEYLEPVNIYYAPNGEQIVDFGQNLTGYVEITTNAKAGELVKILHGEILDKEGNFFNENLRNAKQELTYICKEGMQTYHPHHTFMGFRYLKIEQAPADITYKAIVVHSQMKRTGYFTCGNAKINKLYKNIVWGQRGNFLDIPTDCPQRDERLGWTGDAQVFIRTASYNYDVEKFFLKWLNDLKADQLGNGSVPHVIPNILENNDGSAAWGDASVICPWQLYLSYGNKAVLERQFDSMEKWIKFSENPERFHFGDWLALDEPEEIRKVKDPDLMDNLKGNSNQHLISDAFHLYSTGLFIKIGRILGRDMSEWERYYEGYLLEFQEKYTYHTQTECTIVLYFKLAKNPKEVAKKLAALVEGNGNRLQTGFVGTPYLLHVLSDNGYEDLAYKLLLQEKYPSWLFSVNNGATTVWEHWDGVKEDGSFCECGMNSYNHYAYGAVADWMYQVVAGIRIDEEHPGFEQIVVKPVPNKELQNASASVLTRYGCIHSTWKYEGNQIHYRIVTPVKAKIVIGELTQNVDAGTYEYTIDAS